MSGQKLASKALEPSEWDRANNPLFLIWKEAHIDIFSAPAGKFMSEFRTRENCITSYGFAIPTERALREIAAISSNGIIEIGAGTGYWAKLLRIMGVDVLACDDSSGVYSFTIGSQSRVDRVDYRKILKKDEAHRRTLLVVWPDGDNLQIFDRYRGDTVVYVGELGEGCTGYTEKIEETWEMVKHVKIPVWSGIHDSMGIFKRKGR